VDISFTYYHTYLVTIMLSLDEAYSIVDSMVKFPFDGVLEQLKSIPEKITPLTRDEALGILLGQRTKLSFQKRVGVTKLKKLMTYSNNSKMFSKLLGMKKIPHTQQETKLPKTLTFGESVEPRALTSYVQETGNNPKVVPLAVNPLFPIICAHPDGITFKDGRLDKILEIKSPEILREYSFEEVSDQLNIVYKFRDKWTPCSKVYSQLQLSMAVFGAQESELIIYSDWDQEVTIFPISKDDAFISRTLEAFLPVYKQILSYTNA
jgi:YqaJ-like viral recombinase domain